jgi:hypothetical protein
MELVGELAVLALGLVGYRVALAMALLRLSQKKVAQ